MDLTFTIAHFYQFLATFNNPKQFKSLGITSVGEDEDNADLAFEEEELKSILSIIDKVLPNYSHIIEIEIDGCDLPDVNNEGRRIYDLHLYDRQQAA